MSDDPFAALPEKDRAPASARVLEQWVRQASVALGTSAARTGWILASTIVVAALQRALGQDQQPLFLLKGGVYLERRLGASARATRDVDTLFRGSVDEFVLALDEVLAQPWGPVTLSRTPIQTINAPRIVKPRRFDVLLALRGITWRRVQVEVAFDDGQIREHSDRIAAPSTDFFGIQTPDALVGIAMAYQVAQKLHACTDPHEPPTFVNDRVRDLVDLLSIKHAYYPTPGSLDVVRKAAIDVFQARAVEATQIGRHPRSWPPTIVTNPLWANTFETPAEQAGVSSTLDELIIELNEWITAIDNARPWN
ncbi:nucleotidyl transferase AbiEii/AbiGii toxin family protein [Agromyces laixinhei]|uniref:nucleotidyl transferase AbiEii/AbiGii toxin family protein n=1 Tax=Agromyces laixinhei TaxID=2585717 RepID=UPI001115B594|nr:nucleotidyl transferase AbiEii/AbiGii toxin family protein [Agromyces laixinhei]